VSPGREQTVARVVKMDTDRDVLETM
jgi:hypothetical protein